MRIKPQALLFLKFRTAAFLTAGLILFLPSIGCDRAKSDSGGSTAAGIDAEQSDGTDKSAASTSNPRRKAGSIKSLGGAEEGPSRSMSGDN